MGKRRRASRSVTVAGAVAGYRRHWVLVIATVGAGGSERAASLLTEGWAGRGNRVTMLSFAAPGESPFYRLHPAVAHVPLNLLAPSSGPTSAMVANLRRIAVLRKCLRGLDPDVIVAFGTETAITTVLAAAGLGAPVVVSDRCDPRLWPPSRLWRGLRRLIYPAARVIVAQTGESARFFRWHRRVRIIPNPVPIPQPVDRPLPVRIDHPFLLAVGRLAYQKGFDLLIEAFGRLGSRFPTWSLVIVGEGPEREPLAQRIRKSGLQNRVVLAGRHQDMAPFYAAAAGFVLPSRFEGFPNALAEAMSHGLPVVATDCPSGPRDMIRPDHNGWLVPPEDVVALADALAALCEDAERRTAFGTAAREITVRFGLDQVLDEWERATAR